MTEPRKFLARYSPLPLYPALKQETTDAIAFNWPKTAKDQRHIRNLIKRRNYHFGTVRAARTIVFDVNFMKKSSRNLKWAKSFSNCELHICEPVAFNWIQLWLTMLKQKSINSLNVSIVIHDKNQDIFKRLRLIDKLLKVKHFSLSIENTPNCDFSPNLKKFMKVFPKYFEWNQFRHKSYTLALNGNVVYHLGNTLNSLRHWNPKLKLFLTPDELRDSELSFKNPIKREISFLQIYFHNLKSYTPKALENFINNIRVFNKIGTMRLIMKQFELTPERMKIMDPFFQEIESLNTLQIINYYLKFYKMNFQGLFDFISTRKELEKFSFGFLPLSGQIPSILQKGLGSLSNLNELSLYLDIRSLIQEKNLDFWDFLTQSKSLRKLELILACQSSAVFDDDEVQGPNTYIEGFLKKISLISNLQELYIFLPELMVELGEFFSELMMKIQELKKLEIDCELYNLNYLHELKDLSELRKIRTKVHLPSKNFADKAEELNKINRENFEVELFDNSYLHFTDVHEKYYKRYI